MGRPRPQPALWRHEHLIAALPALAYLERASVHVRLGWLPKLEAIETKIAVGQHQYADAMTAAKLERSYFAMTRLTGRRVRGVPGELRALMMNIDAATSDVDVVRRIYLEVKPALAARYAELIEKADRVLDAHLLEVLEPALAETERQIAWAKQTLGTRKLAPARVTKLLAAGGGRRVPRDKWLWEPLDRAPRCVRIAPLVRVRPGKLAHRLADAPGTRGAIGEFFHHLTGTELSTMELYARCCYEHPTMPEEFHQDYSRVIWDEARHAALALRGAAKFGVPFGTMTIDVSSYDANYEYRSRKPGTRDELLWRLLIQGTFQESLIIEGFPLQAKKMRFAKFEDAARVAEVLAEEEVSHVAIALKWARYLCGGDKQRVLDERAAAHLYQHQNVMEARRRYVAEDPDRAIAETEKLQAYGKAAKKRFPFSLKVYVNRPARRAAGFTDQEIEQIVSWGYFYT